MSKWDVDFDDYEEKEGQGYSGDEPKPGIYEAKLITYKAHANGKSDTSLEVICEITQEPFAGWRGWSYMDLENAKWKTQQLVKAIQGGSEKPMRLDPERAEAVVKKAKPFKVRIKNEPYDGGKKAKIASFIPLEGGGAKGKKATSDDPWASDDDD